MSGSTVKGDMLTCGETCFWQAAETHRQFGQIHHRRPKPTLSRKCRHQGTHVSKTVLQKGLIKHPLATCQHQKKDMENHCCEILYHHKNFETESQPTSATKMTKWHARHRDTPRARGRRHLQQWAPLILFTRELLRVFGPSIIRHAVQHSEATPRRHERRRTAQRSQKTSQIFTKPSPRTSLPGRSQEQVETGRRCKCDPCHRKGARAGRDGQTLQVRYLRPQRHKNRSRRTDTLQDDACLRQRLRSKSIPTDAASAIPATAKVQEQVETDRRAARAMPVPGTGSGASRYRQTLQV